MGRPVRLAALLVVALATSVTASAGSVAAADDDQEFVLLYRSDAAPAAARQAIQQAGGTVVKENPAIGVATVTSSNPDFLADVTGAKGAAVIEGGSRNRVIGSAPIGVRPKPDDVERVREAVSGPTAKQAPGPAATPPGAEPLAGLQWDMAMVHATVDGSYHVQRGDKRVLVGIIDTGIDGSHPDIAPNFNRTLSRNFTTDIPLIDGPCEEEPDQSCSDPADVDENEHGTHVAGIVAAAYNGLGIAGVAPNVTLVNLRAGQDSGYFFLQSTVDALTYAADNGIDVVNMSFYTDPWLYNCAHNPADTPAEQQEQRTIITATQRALDYATSHNVTLVAALGNEHTDLGHPTVDATSPDFPPGTEHTRTVDNSCLDLPTEGHNVIGVSSLGPSGVKADYSNYGIERTDVSAPGGYFRDGLGTPSYRTPGNLILSAYPESLARANGDLDADGVPNNPFVVRDCANGVCAYYQYLQGTSMAAPHAAGVAALIVSQYGKPDPYERGLFLPPPITTSILERTATDHDCPTPRLMTYTDVGRPADWDALCEENRAFNGFYGNGIVDALAAVRGRPGVS